jgi:hypothetical protein
MVKRQGLMGRTIVGAPTGAPSAVHWPERRPARHPLMWVRGKKL